MYTVYILQSKTTKHYYVGMTSDINNRLRHHYSGANKSTRNKGPWLLIYQEDFKEKREAWLREKQIKSYKGGEVFKKLLSKIGEVA